jgi:predicted ATPase/DNA-binding CsgD family transcriptional regulator
MTGTGSKASAWRQHTGLPAEVTSFVGRRHEVAEVRRLLSESRLVTLTGVGGIGKTRLAVRVAEEVRRAFPGGVWLVELGRVRNPDHLAATVAEVLRVRASSLPPLDALVGRLREERALLILDNCEHLLDGCAALIKTLLQEAPDVRFLITSRHVLGLAGEQLLVVPALPLPAPGSTRHPLRSFTDNDAVRLFTERARAVVPGFAVTEANREAVGGLCRRLDGIPLEIEMAAGRLRILSVQQLLDRLDEHLHDRFHLLTAGAHTLSRHRTLRALVDWSGGLCTEPERLLWARASVFPGGLDLDAAEEVCSGGDIARDKVIDLVAGLVDKSVLVREEDPAGVRYRLLESLREYGRELLARAGEEAAVRRRHREHYRCMAAGARRQVFGPAQTAAVMRLRSEHLNLVTALDHLQAECGMLRRAHGARASGRPGTPGYGVARTDTGETERASGASGIQGTTGRDTAPPALCMVTDLLHHWITGPYLSEGRRRLDEALATVPGPSTTRARALWAGGRLALTQGDIDSALAMLRECRDLVRLPGYEEALGHTALLAGMLAARRGELASAVRLYTVAAAHHRASGDHEGLALAKIRLSLARSLLDDVPGALCTAEDCLALCDARQERWHRAYATIALGVAAWRQGDTRWAAPLVKDGLRFDSSLGDLLGVGLGLEVLAWIAATEGRHQRAARLLGMAEARARAGDAPLSGFAELAPFHEGSEDRIRSALGEPAFRTARGHGAELSYEAALAYALEEPASAPGESAEALDPSPLTPRETEIARLVAKGLSNKEIAAALTIAVRTAEGHIEHILSKLNFNSRTRIAVWVGEQGLAERQKPEDEQPQ